MRGGRDPHNPIFLHPPSTLQQNLPMWLQQTTPSERRTLTATFAGYGVDGFDYMIYTFLIPTLLAAWNMSKAEAGYIATGALLTSAVGGWAAGVLADRYGRVRVLQWTVLWFALFTFLSGFTNSFGQLFFTRAMQGFGMGGEWAVGSVLIAETISARHRGKAAGLVQSSWAVGWAASALAFWGMYAVLPPEQAWKVLFWIGILPAVLILYIRRNLGEPEVYLAEQARMRASGQRSNFLRIFHPSLLRTTVLASLLATGMQGAYYSVTTWLPTFLKTERQLSVLGTSTYLLVLIAGSFVGYLTSAWLSGRHRPAPLLHPVCRHGRRPGAELHPDPHHRQPDAGAGLSAGLLPVGHLLGHGRLPCQSCSPATCVVRARASATTSAAPSAPSARPSSANSAPPCPWARPSAGSRPSATAS